ncbi:UDPglucose 6-dehydrogenase [Paraburkholderia sp. BL6669N2]|uniref:UDP-glucose dehydrogenase family protein n=1 Tax=Paraburkholderia sp. BL6669N2 TaxID=1938807 RepID=UPI000E22E627|nr:UDP-glucose/GDP-mannose dehydrogenase family protein [Paraburkholderia sp. BL6669N2]REG45615.1 UDPglucose 6-dehydrogenase [Paraburkholderia sp. BL6669N2]
MKITVIGSGYVGLVTGACLAEVGNDVFCLDLDQKKIDRLKSGDVPIYEPGLPEIISRNVSASRLQFSSDVRAAVDHGDIQFIAVGTPPGEDGSADLQYVLAAAKNIARYANTYKIVVNKSTVPIGTAERVRVAMDSVFVERGVSSGFSVVSNPEFLKEGAAVEDFMRPDRIIIGIGNEQKDAVAREAMARLYKPFNRNHERTLFMDTRSAELTKYAANAMLATRISFMNEMAELAEKVGADVEDVRQGIGSDPRIGYHFLYPGCGYGGSCFPKDVKALVRISEELNSDAVILKSVELRNARQKGLLSERVVARFGPDLTNKRFAVWGLSFKPNTDDMREAPSRYLITSLLERGAKVFAYDPVAMKEAEITIGNDLKGNIFSENIQYVSDKMDAIAGADALIIVTEWKEFRSQDLSRVRDLLKTPVIFDGRNIYDLEIMDLLEFEYHGIGRQNNIAKSCYPNARQR